MTITDRLSPEHAPDSLPVAPSLEPALAAVNASVGSGLPRMPAPRTAVDGRVLFIALLAIALGLTSSVVARVLTALIALITNVAFYGRLSFVPVGPAGNHLGWLVLAVPVLGGLVVGVMARYGSAAIRGHGIPEAMEQVLLNESRIPARLTFLKPLSAAVSIGTGGPFGAEGPIIATGGALGSLVGQVLRVSAEERKTLLAAGAAAGMSATFASPVSAVLLAVELLLFEYRLRSVVPVALASAAACGARIAFVGDAPAFAMSSVHAASGMALTVYVAVGLVVGFVSMLVTRAVYLVEDAFEKLHGIHWMWWPAFGGLAVGGIGFFAPHTMGVGYDNIDRILSGDLAGTAVITFCLLKLVSWAVSLGSGTSGGTLAPLFTIGGGLGSALGGVAIWLLPAAEVDVRVAALVGMASMFAGASRALLTSIVFAFETTRQPMTLLPLLGGCALAYLVSALTMRNSIMTEKIARRGTRIVSDYAADFLDQVSVKDVAAMPATVLRADETVAQAQAWLSLGDDGGSYRAYPVVDGAERLVGVLTREDVYGAPLPTARLRDLITRPLTVVEDDASLRDAADHMIAERVSRLPVVSRAEPYRVLGILTRGDVLGAHGPRLDREQLSAPRYKLPSFAKRAARTSVR